jgi:hypothetical protein
LFFIYLIDLADSDESDGRFLVDFNRKRQECSDDDDDDDVSGMRKERDIPEHMRHVYAPAPQNDSVNTKTQAATTSQQSQQEDDTEVHYQHVSSDGLFVFNLFPILRFSDARELGAGYFKFSTNQEKRAQQMRDLHNLHAEVVCLVLYCKFL